MLCHKLYQQLIFTLVNFRFCRYRDSAHSLAGEIDIDENRRLYFLYYHGQETVDRVNTCCQICQPDPSVSCCDPLLKQLSLAVGVNRQGIGYN